MLDYALPLFIIPIRKFMNIFFQVCQVFDLMTIQTLIVNTI